MVPAVQEAYRNLVHTLAAKIPGMKVNRQRYYISLRKKRNFAYLKFGKKKIGLIAMAEEATIRRYVKGYGVSTLSDGVQNFYNGPCARVHIDSGVHLNEVIGLLLAIQR